MNLRAISSQQNLHNHFFSKLSLCARSFFMPRPPYSLLRITLSHLTRLYPFFSLLPCHRNTLLALLIFSLC
uniref:Putative ovule protein n=1 Tax=Solanum chacoense TaxID=4108 RepID=A0A0V0HEF3_SOLCH